MTAFPLPPGPDVVEGGSHSLYRLASRADGGDTRETLYRQEAVLITHFGSLAQAARAIACLADCAHLLGRKPSRPGAIINLLVAAQQLEDRL